MLLTHPRSVGDRGAQPEVRPQTRCLHKARRSVETTAAQKVSGTRQLHSEFSQGNFKAQQQPRSCQVRSPASSEADVQNTGLGLDATCADGRRLVVAASISVLLGP